MKRYGIILEYYTSPKYRSGYISDDMILFSEGGTKSEEADAHKVLEILCEVYPGHPWAVRVEGGCIFIRHLEMGKNWGMNAKFKDVAHDSAVFKREVIMKAGEFLERAGLSRGRANGDEIERVDGIPEKDQPYKHKIGRIIH